MEIEYTAVVMPAVEVVWRHLLDGARHGQRRWPSMTAVAAELEAPISTVHRSLSHPIEIGAVSISAMGGLQVLDPARLLVLFAAHRHLRRDITRRFQVGLAVSEVESLVRSPTAILGGFGAVVAHLGGVNRIADYTAVLFYGDPDLPDLPPASEYEGTQVLIAEPDPLLGKYGRVTPFSQAYADLFSLPGWQSARFVEELDVREVAASDEPVLLV
jgi:hypothetical protein